MEQSATRREADESDDCNNRKQLAFAEKNEKKKKKHRLEIAYSKEHERVERGLQAYCSLSRSRRSKQALSEEHHRAFK
jgi:hypothetical protein